MKKLVSLLSCLLLIGCGEKSSSKGSESASEKPTASNDSAETAADTAKPPPAERPVAESPSEEPSETPDSLSDADVERLLKDAVDYDSLQERDDLYYQANEVTNLTARQRPAEEPGMEDRNPEGRPDV